MTLENKSNITNQVALAKAQEKIREANIAKGNLRFAPMMHLHQSLEHINTVPQGSFDEIIEKYGEMNIAHSFCKESGHAASIWLDLILKTEIKQVVGWDLVDKDDYLLAMQRSVAKDIEIKALLNKALTDQIPNRALFMKRIDVSYCYEAIANSKPRSVIHEQNR